jgi:hypothetical protein
MLHVRVVISYQKPSLAQVYDLILDAEHAAGCHTFLLQIRSVMGCHASQTMTVLLVCCQRAHQGLIVHVARISLLSAAPRQIAISTIRALCVGAGLVVLAMVAVDLSALKKEKILHFAISHA